MGKPLTEGTGKALIAKELALAKTADRIVAVSEVEAQQYRAAGCNDVIVLGHALELQPTASDFGARSGFLFMAPSPKTIAPTVTASCGFDHVWPTIQAQLGDAAQLDIVGVCESPKVQARRSASVRLCGRVDDLSPTSIAARSSSCPRRAGVPQGARGGVARAAHGDHT